MAYGYSNLLIELQALNYAFNKNSVSIFTDNYITEDYFDKYISSTEISAGLTPEIRDA